MADEGADGDDGGPEPASEAPASDRRAPDGWGRWRVLRLPSGLLLPVVAVGVGGALAGAAYLGVLHLLQRLLWPEGHSAWIQAVILVATGGFVALGTRLLGPTGGVGLLVDNIHVLGGADDLRQTRSMVPISLACVAAGGAMGAEAPLVQSTGSLGTWTAQRLGLDREGLRILTITGMAAGFTVLFGAPMGAALFALEILHHRGLQYYEAILPAMVGSLSGLAVSAVVMQAGLRPVWRFPAAGELATTDLAWGLAMGVLGAGVAAGFCLVVRGLRPWAGRVPGALLPVLGGLALAGLGAWSPYALTFGEVQIDELLVPGLGVGALLVALAAKFLGTVVTLVSGWKGGFIIPLFFMGVAAAQVVCDLAPSANTTVVVTALMAACCVGVTKTPLGTTLVVTAMAGVVLLPTTLAAAVVALLLTDRLVLIEGQRDRVVSPGPAAGDA